MKKKIDKRNAAKIFNEKYSNVTSVYKLAMKIIKNDLKIISKEASKLYDFANKNCYTTDKYKPIKSIKGIKKLNDKMDNLENIVDVCEGIVHGNHW